jgi:wyosine [tRNA(Phe)-imidazoG37] synthetase (radical SAM superfamily)
MSKPGFRHVRGPVSARRSGRSLGVDVVPVKMGLYDCFECQLGRTLNKTIEPKQCISRGARA